jgi:pimeloyl-ACP methyl ester carboxylesterase
MHIATEDQILRTADGGVFARRWRTGSRRTPIILLHDSLGSVELWRDFPAQLAQACGRDVLAYDRLGYGRSAVHPGGWSNHFIREEAERYFPPVWQALDSEEFIVLGHSVGAIMAASVAAYHRHHCRALITVAALAFVEDRTRQGIRQAEATFSEPAQRDRLSKYHGDKTDWILSAWIDTWLDQSFAGWTLEQSAPAIACPLLAIHGQNDEYGSVAHLERVTALAQGPVEQLLLEGCQHVPHREQPARVLATIERFLQDLA